MRKDLIFVNDLSIISLDMAEHWPPGCGVKKACFIAHYVLVLPEREWNWAEILARSSWDAWAEKG